MQVPGDPQVHGLSPSFKPHSEWTRMHGAVKESSIHYMHLRHAAVSHRQGAQ